MLGVLRWDGAARGVSPPEPIVIAGLPVLEVRLALGGRWEERRVRRAGRLLARQGVRRVLLPQGFTHRRALSACGLAAVEPLPLYRAMAPELTLALLAQRGVPPREACVLLCGRWAQGDLARTARALCPRVRRLALNVEGGGEALERALCNEFGVPLWPRGGVSPHVRVRFDGAPEEGELALSPAGTALCGLRLDAPVDHEDGVERDALLTALWQAELLAVGSIAVKTP